MMTTGGPPPRLNPLPPEVRAAAIRISPVLWNQPYRDQHGSMHYAGGPAHADRLLAKANEWERLAAAARVCAAYLADA